MYAFLMDPFVSVDVQLVNDALGDDPPVDDVEAAAFEREIADVQGDPEQAKRVARRIRTTRGWGRRPEVVMVDPNVDIDDLYGVRAEVLAASTLLAVEANSPAVEPKVQAWRDEHLGVGVRLTWDEVEAWVDEKAAEDGRATMLIGFPAPEGVEFTFDPDTPVVIPSEPIRIDADHPIPLPFRRSWVPVMYGLPDSQYSIPKLVRVRGVLDSLRALAEDLSGRYRWTKAQATVFVLTGLTPLISPISTTISEGQIPATNEVTITIRPTATRDDVMDAFQAARRKFFGSRTRAIPERQAHLVLYRLGRLHHTPDETWTQTQQAWNEHHQTARPGWKFTTAKQVKRDFNSARRRLLQHERRTP